MLILNRKPGEIICIEDDSSITVESVQGRSARLKIEYKGRQWGVMVRKGTTFHLCADINAKALSVSPYSVELGIQAPVSVDVDRLEIRERKLREAESKEAKL